MANLRETATWETGIYQWETSDPVMGGENGIDNLPTRQLANRTQWLKTELAKAIALIGTNQTAMGNITISVGAGLIGGGNLTANRTIGLATPSTLSGSTENWAGNGTTGHTHKLAMATSQIAGVVKLADNLSTNDGSMALSAKQGFTLLNALKSMGYDNLDKGASSRAGIDLNTLTDHGSVTYVNYAGTNIAKTLPEWWQKYNLPSAETQWGVVLVYRESASIVYQLFLTALGQVWFRFRSLSNPASTFNKRGWVRLDGAEWDDVRNKPNFALVTQVMDLTSAQDITGEKTFQYQIKLKNQIAGVAYTARFGTNNNDTFIQNGTTGKYLQLKNDGSLQYDNKKVYHEGNKPVWADLGYTPVRQGGGTGQGNNAIKIGWSGSRLKAQVDDTDLGNIVFDNQLNDAINNAVPSGTVAYFLGAHAPQGWIKANGATLSRTVYAQLFAAIGTHYGAGDGHSTFNIPDLRGEFIRGWDDGRGVDGGRGLGSWQGDEIRSHNHGQAWGLHHEGGNDMNCPASGEARRRENEFNIPTHHTGGNETRPRNIALTAIIKV